MATLVLFSVLTGFYFFYHTSGRAVPPRSLVIEKWIHGRPQVAKFLGTILLLGSVILSVGIWGLGAGVLLFFIVLMTLGSLVIVLSPVRVLNYKVASLLIILSLILENALL